MATQEGQEAASAAAAAETKSCSACSQDLPRDGFNKKQWMCRQQRRCKECVEAGRPIIATGSSSSSQQQSANASSSNKKKKGRNKPVRAGKHEGMHKPTSPDAEFVAQINGYFCSWCGKAEEQEDLMFPCPECKNVLYCSRECQKAGWKEHKEVCGKLKQDRKDWKKEQKANRDGASMETFTEASGVGNFALIVTPLFSTMTTNGELRGFEQAGSFFASEAAEQNIRAKLDHNGFRQLCQRMGTEPSGPFRRSEYFYNVTDLQHKDQFLLSCGVKKDLEHARAVLPIVLHQISISGLKPDGSIPDIGDITVRGYGLNALELAARRGNYEIAEWLATDPRTKVMVTRKDSAPVAWACYTNKVELAKMLVANGADSHATSGKVFGKKPPSHLAAENGQLLAVKFLVEECGHDIHERDDLGMNIRTSLRQNNKVWRSQDGCVAVDNYAKSKGVREYA